MKSASLTVVIVLATSMVSVFAHTPAQTNAVVRGALLNFINYSSKRLVNLPRKVSPTEVPDNWYNFLGGYMNDGWTLEGKKAAFDWYLGTLGTNDCVAMSGEDRSLARAAIIQCKSLHHTNCVPAMRALALNPRGICRTRAIALVIEFGTIDDTMMTFIESIMTNVTTYTQSERGLAVGLFSDKLVTYNSKTEEEQALIFHMVERLYRNRCCDIAGVNSLDYLFNARIEGYAISSNRLEFANFVLQHSGAQSFNIQKFTSVTNQLLSSGQPLPWINVGMGGN